MPLDFETAKGIIVGAFKKSKLSGLAPLVERAVLTREYTNYQYDKHPKTKEERYIRCNDTWVTILILCVGYGVLYAFPEEYPEPASEEVDAPFLLTASNLNDVYTYRKVEYNADIIKKEIERFCHEGDTVSRMQVPEGTDDVSVADLGAALDRVDTAIQLTAGSGVAVSKDAITKKQTIVITPFTTLNAVSNVEFPSSAAVAAYVEAQVSGSGTYQGQFDYFGTMAQIKARTVTGNATGIYLDTATNNVFIITCTGGVWQAAGVEYGSQVSGDSYDIRNLIEYPATGGGYESGQIRLVIDGEPKTSS
jgi:hypothetical protein